MKLHTAVTEGLNIVTAYGDDFVAVNGVRHAGSVLVRSVGEVEAWAVTSVADLDGVDLAPLLRGHPHVILLGTGARQHFPSPAARRRLATAGIAVEVMDTGAAARTFNILVGEGRDAVCALIVGA